MALSGDPIAAIRRSGFEFLPVKPEHGWQAAKLPLLYPVPFDRLFVAQTEGLYSLQAIATSSLRRGDHAGLTH